MAEPHSNQVRHRLELTSRIVAAYVRRNVIRAGDLQQLIAETHAALTGAPQGKNADAADVEQRPAVPVKKSVTGDFIICLEDGRKFKSLRRHLMAKYGLTPEQYRQKWNLPADYPMTAPNYARQRSDLARASGLGKRSTAPTPAPEPAPPARKKIGLKFR